MVTPEDDEVVTEDEEDDPRLAEYERLTDALDKHPGTLADRLMSDIQRACTTWLQRSLELRALVQHGETDDEMQIELMQNVRPPTARDNYVAALDSTLNAYLAAMGALIDVARRVAQQMPDDFRAEYLARSEAVRAIDGVSVLRDLRNYMLHYSAAPWHFSGAIKDNTMTSCVGLDSAALSAWDRWSATSKTYLRRNDVVPLRNIITPYEAAMIRLFEWFATDFYRHKQPDLDAANDLVRRVNLHLTGGVSDGADWPQRVAHMAENIRRANAGEPQINYETGEPIPR
jgi:hypothetical protein